MGGQWPWVIEEGVFKFKAGDVGRVGVVAGDEESKTRASSVILNKNLID